MTICSLALFVSIVACTPAFAQELKGRSQLPPPEYDHPYPGLLKIYRVADPEAIMQSCPRAIYVTRIPLGCTRMGRDLCEIYLIPDAMMIKRFGYDPALVYRHEIGHCNGWLH